MIREVLQAFLLLFGSLFILISAIGILRMPDLFMRLQVTSKASVLGLVCILIAVALYFDNTVVTIRAAVIISFLVLTIPVATHMLARAGYTTNVPISDETVVNDLTGHYDHDMHLLVGDEPVEWNVELAAGAGVVGMAITELDFPPDVLILQIERAGAIIVPQGQTVLEAHDKLRVLAHPDDLQVVRRLLEAPSGETPQAGESSAS